MEKGYVYILTNDSFREDWVKIGKSSRPVDVRSKELDNTAVPLPFNIYATLETARYSQVERLIHKTIDRLTDLRIRQNREFFNVSPEVALDMLVDIAKVTDDAVITIYRDNKPFQVLNSEEPRKPRDLGKPQVNKKRACNFRFSMIGLKAGDIITFDPTGLQVRVASDTQIEHDGRLYKLSPFVGTFLPEELQSNSRSYQGPKYFSFHGETLSALRAKAEAGEHRNEGQDDEDAQP